MTRPTLLIRIEAAAAALVLILLLAGMGPPWWLWVAVLAAPDLSLAGYLAGPRAGAAAYNLAHFAALPLALLAGVLVTRGIDATGTDLQVALLWLLHIAVDRAAGYGLKLPSGFGETHLGRIGRVG